MELNEFKYKYNVIAKIAKEYDFDINDDLDGGSFISHSLFSAIMRYDVFKKKNNSLAYSIETSDENEAIEGIIEHFNIDR